MALGVMASGPSAALVYADKPAEISQDELDLLAAPIALYPDPLLAHVLAASTYPAEVGEAVRFVEDNPGMRGQELALKVNDRNWAPSVAALVQFPMALAMMGEHADWVRKLGDAMLEEPGSVLQTIQTLRGLAIAEGSLASVPEQKVMSDGDLVSILPARPREVCVPVYDPATAFGPWWLPDSPPIAWKPKRPGAPRIRNLLAGGVSFMGCTAVAGAPFASAVPDWSVPELTITWNGRRGPWVHDPSHRRGVPYRTAAVRETFSPAGPASGVRRTLSTANGNATGVTILRPKPAVEPMPGEGDGR